MTHQPINSNKTLQINSFFSFFFSFFLPLFLVTQYIFIKPQQTGQFPQRLKAAGFLPVRLFELYFKNKQTVCKQWLFWLNVKCRFSAFYLYGGRRCKDTTQISFTPGRWVQVTLGWWLVTLHYHQGNWSEAKPSRSNGTVAAGDGPRLLLHRPGSGMGG